MNVEDELLLGALDLKLLSSRRPLEASKLWPMAVGGICCAQESQGRTGFICLGRERVEISQELPQGGKISTTTTKVSTSGRSNLINPWPS